MDEKQILRIMEGLKCSKEEAIEIHKSDLAIDKNEPMPFDLPKEQEKIAKKYTHTGTKKTVYNFNKRERKPNEIKQAIVQELFELFNQKEGATEVQVTNKERQISFKYEDNVFEVTLVQKRKK